MGEEGLGLLAHYIYMHYMCPWIFSNSIEYWRVCLNNLIYSSLSKFFQIAKYINMNFILNIIFENNFKILYGMDTHEIAVFF